MTFVLVGASSLLVRCGECLLERGHRVTAVVTSDEAVQEWAARLGIRHLPLSGGLAAALRPEPFDVLLSIGTLVVLPADLIRLPTRAAVTFHDGPLPRYGGLNSPAWALLDGETEHGVTWHRMVPQAGAGNVLVQRRVAIGEDDTALTLNAKCVEAGLESFDDVLAALADGRPGTPHTLDAATFRLAAHRPASMGVLDWTQPATHLARLARALDFGPYRNPLTRPKLLVENDHVIVAQVTTASAQPAPAGTVLAVEPGAITVAAADGAVRLAGFVTADGSPLAAADLDTRWQVRPGAMLPCPGREALRGLDDALAPIARAERDWILRLEALEPATLADGGGAEHAAREHVQPLSQETATALTPPGASAPDAICAAIALFVAAVTGRHRLDVATPAYLSALPDTARGLVLPWVPVRCEFNPATPVTNAVAAAAAAIRAARHRAPIARDLWHRMPQLDGRHARPQVAIGISNGQPDPAGAIGATLAVTVDPHGVVTWRSTRATLDPSRLAARFASMIEQILAAPLAPAGTIDALTPDERGRVLESWASGARAEPAFEPRVGAPAP